MILHNYFRSSASFRVRIALNLKGLDYQYASVHLTKDGGEQLKSNFEQLNPDHLVPVLEDDQHVLSQSLAIIEYLDEVYPQPTLLPGNAADRAHIRALALHIACEIHPLNNLRVLRYLKEPLGVAEQDKNTWYRHWVEQGLASFEQRLVNHKCNGKFCYGDTPTVADCCLIPQIFNAKRFNSDLSGLPTVMSVFEHCMRLSAFKQAQPDQQPDASSV